METNRLRQFCVIAETGSITKAAALLCITHSGLSKSMKLLQDELACVLLRPSGRGLALTEDGLRVYHSAKQFLAQEEQLFSAKPQVRQQTLKIGTVEVFLLAQCEQFTHPELANYHFTLLDLNPGQIEQFIVNGQLDYGITYAPYPIEGIEITDIGQYQLGCYCLEGRFKGMDISDIPFAVPAQGLSNHPLGIKERDGWLESITPRNRKFSVNLLSTGLELTRLGLCAIFIPKFVARNYPNLVELTIPKSQKATQRVFIIRHKDRPQDHLFKIIKKSMKAVVQV
jgi:DNA-binding transcriptional LysR family regulator